METLHVYDIGTEVYPADYYRSWENTSKANWTNRTGFGEMRVSGDAWDGSYYWEGGNIGTQVYYNSTSAPFDGGIIWSYTRHTTSLSGSGETVETSIDFLRDVGGGDDGAPQSYPYVFVEYVEEGNQKEVELRIEVYDENITLLDSFYGDISGSTGGWTEQGYGRSGWVGLKVQWIDSTGVLKVWHDPRANGGWTLLYTSSTLGSLGTTDFRCATFNTSSWDDNDGLDYCAINTTGDFLTTADYLPSKLEFYVEESSIGGGYMFVPERNVDFSADYDVQEVEFKIADGVGQILFYGVFTEPIKAKDGVRFNFKEISYQLHDHFCKRDYNLQKGKIKDVGTL